MTHYNTTKPQHVNGFGGPQIITYAGKCAVCGRKVYAIADAATPDHKEDPDPRGHIDAYHARATLSASEYDKFGPDLITCWHCRNERETYVLAVAKARAIWYDSDTCDHGEDEHKPCYRLDLGNSGGVFLCREHWLKEMSWRRRQNESLELECRFDILPFPGTGERELPFGYSEK